MSAGAFRLMLPGNTNIPAMTNAILRATLELRSNLGDDSATFNPIHVFHTEESLRSLTGSTLPWRDILAGYSVSVSSLVHHVTRLEESSIERFRDLVQQLKTVVDPLLTARYYVDLTGGVSSLKTILAVFAYVLDIDHLYSLEVAFSDDATERRRQLSMFLPELEQAGVPVSYRRFPPIRDFDAFGKMNYTEIIRHRDVIEIATRDLANLLPQHADLGFLSGSLLAGVHQRLLADVTGNASGYRHAIFSSAASVEEVANYLLLSLGRADLENKPLGQKLAEVRDAVKSSSSYFMTEKTLEHLTRLIGGIRNEIVHPEPGATAGTAVLALQAQLASQLAMSFIHFATKSIGSFLDRSGELLEVEVLASEPEERDEVFYFGFDGDFTGDFIERGFGDHADEKEVAARSQIIRRTLHTLVGVIRQEMQDENAVIFAEGDNILFRGEYRQPLIEALQRKYREQTGLTSSIGFGRTLKEASVALRLAKAKPDDACVGVRIKGDRAGSARVETRGSSK